MRISTITLLFFVLLSTAFLVSSAVAVTSRKHLNHRRYVRRRIESLSTSSPIPLPLSTSLPPSRIFHAVEFGADPTGTRDSSAALTAAISAATSASHSSLMPSIPNFGGAEIHLDGGIYLISSPLSFPPSGNLKIHSGSLRSSESFPSGRHLIELHSPSHRTYEFGYITIAGLVLDANFAGGGISIDGSLRVIIDGCYIVHFTTDGISVSNSHDNFIRNCFIGQHITVGGDPTERNFSGTGILLNANDNAITDVVIFSAAIGILVSGQANTITGVHLYNKAAAFGGTGIYLKLPGLTQTRIENCYFDYNGIVAEDPVQLVISGSFFLGDANVAFKAIKGIISGVNVVDNMFSGLVNHVHNVWLDESGGIFRTVNQIVVNRNNVRNMKLRSTVAMASATANGTIWSVDFSSVLLFPNRIDNVQYSLIAESGFPAHALRSVESNCIVIMSDMPVMATVHVEVSQCVGT